MKYVWAGLAVVAAIAALVFRPPAGTGPRVAPTGEPSAKRDDPALTPAHQYPNAGVERRSAAARIMVYVAGEVVRPGVYALAPEARAQDALARAGGPKPDADLVAVNLAERLDDGVEVAVPKVGEAAHSRRRAASPHLRSKPGVHGGRHGRRRKAAPENPPARSVDLNTAPESQLESLPGIGPALAARIVTYRETNGPFASVDELADVAGITAALQAKIAGFVVVR